MAVSEMTESLQRVGEQPLELSVEERNLLSVAYGSTAGCRRAAWRIITSIEQKENLKADDAKHSPKIVLQDRILQGTVEQILDVLVLEKAERLVEAPKTIPQDRIQQHTVEHITADTPVPQDAEEPAEFFKAFSQDRVQLRFRGQIIEKSAIPLAEKIVELPVIQTEEKTRQGVNVCVQHVVNAVEVEKHIIKEKINQETKRIEIPPLQFMDKAIDIPVVAQRQVPQVHVVKKTVEDPQFEIVEKTVENPETVPQMQVVEKTTGIPQLQVADKMVDVPAVFVVLVTQVQVVGKTVQISQLPLVEKIAAEIRTALGTQTSENLNGEFDAGHDEKSGQVDVERVRQHRGAAAWQRQPRSIKQQPTVQTAQEKEREIERRGVRGEKKKRGHVEKEKGQGERERGERGKREEETGEERKEVQEETENEVEKDVTGWTEVTRNKRKKMVQIFVKVDGMKTAAMEVSPEDKVKKILNIVSKSDRDVYVTSGGRILKGVTS